MTAADPTTLPWRTGRRVGRTIYVDHGAPDPNDGSLLTGVMDTAELAAAVVDAHNRLLVVTRTIEASGGQRHEDFEAWRVTE